MTDRNETPELLQAVQRYLDLMHDPAALPFENVFLASASVHGLRDGAMTALTADAFRALITGRPSPRALGAPREEEILALDFASPDQAVAKVRVRIGATVFVDQLAWHRIGGDWRVTAKSFHVERVHPH